MRADINRTSTFGILLRPFADVFDPPFQFLFVADRVPLKRRVRLWHKAVERRDDLARTAEFLAGLEHSVLDPLDEDEHLVEVFLRFGRQADHHIKLDGQHSAVENGAADIDDLVVGQILVDHAAQTVGAGFGCDGDLLVASIRQVRRAIRPRSGQAAETETEIR